MGPVRPRRQRLGVDPRLVLLALAHPRGGARGVGARDPPRDPRRSLLGSGFRAGDLAAHAAGPVISLRPHRLPLREAAVTDEHKKVRPTARPDAQTLKEPQP